MNKRKIISTSFLLPFRLPIRDGLRYVRQNKYGHFEFIFNTLITKKYPYSYNVSCFRSSILIKYIPFIPLDTHHLIDELRGFLYGTLEIINSIIRAIKEDYGLQEIYELALTDLPSIINIKFLGKTIPYIINVYAFKNYNIYNTPADLAIIKNKIISLESSSSIILENHFFENAKILYIKEHFNETVIYLETAFEIFVFSTIENYLLSISAEPEDIEKAKNSTLRSAIVDRIASYVKVDLEYYKTAKNNIPNANYNSNIGKWYQNLYVLRNNIVHDGYKIRYGEEIRNAILAYQETREYIISLFKNIGFNTFSKIIQADLNQNNGQITDELLSEIKEYRTFRKLYYTPFRRFRLLFIKLKRLLVQK